MASKHLAEFLLYPRTGRTHQLRVHLESIGFPILGDELYGGDWDDSFEDVPRLMLHAEAVTFVHPETKKTVSFQVAPPWKENLI